MDSISPSAARPPAKERCKANAGVEPRRDSDVGSDHLLAAALDAWEHGVRRWNERHDYASYPTAFSKLAHVMDDIQRHLDAANGKDETQ